MTRISDLCGGGAIQTDSGESVPARLQSTEDLVTRAAHDEVAYRLLRATEACTRLQRRCDRQTAAIKGLHETVRQLRARLKGSTPIVIRSRRPDPDVEWKEGKP